MNAIFKGKLYGSATIGERGQIVIPSDLRKAFHIKSGDQLMVFARVDKKIINLMPAKEFSNFLNNASELIAKLERKIPKNR